MTQPYKIVDGVKIDLTDDEVAALQLEQSTWLTGQNNRDIKQQILILETSVSPRRLREAIAGMDNGWLANVNSQIATLRGQLT